MTTVRRFASALCAILCAVPRPAAAAPPHAPPPPRTWAVIPFYAPERMWALYSPPVEYLRRETGEPWTLALYASHDALIDEFCAGKVAVALLGPIPLARANRRCGAVPFLVPLGPDGSPTYHSVLVTTDPGVTSLEALRGKEIGFFRGSTAAHLVPMKMLAEAGLDPGSYSPVFLESQDRLVSALLSRKISAAGVKSALFRRFDKEPGLRQLRTSGPLPNFSFAALPSLPAVARERFAAALLGLRPRERTADAKRVETWDDEIRHGFVRPPPEFLAQVLALQEATEALLRERP